MIRVTLRRDAEGRLRGFDVRGHSGYAAKGSDIVCAAVSALTQGAALGLTRHLGIPVPCGEGEGWLDCRLPADVDPVLLVRAQDILETMRLSLEEIARGYPRHVVVEERGP